MKKQPAHINYFFRDAYGEFWDTITNTFSQCGERISDSWYDLTDAWGELWENILEIVGLESVFANFIRAIWHSLVLGFFVGKLVLSTVLIPVICIIFSAVQLIAVLILMIFVYLGYILFALSDWIYCQCKKISNNCPNCQTKFAHATYVCQCGAKHTKLVPSKYGILKRECECYRKLSTTFFNGREKLPGKWICPNCSKVFTDIIHEDLPIPVVGGPSSGKTCYISMAITQIEKTASSYDLEFEYHENADLGDDYNDNKEQMNHGRLPMKTNDMRLRYYQFFLSGKGQKVRSLVSLCDVAGETYEHNDEMARQIGFQNANGFLMIIDPLSVAAYRKEVAKTTDISKYGASEKPMDEVLDALIHTLESMKCIDSKSSIKTDVAVLFTKGDIPGLAEKIGDEAVARYLQTHEGITPYEAKNIICEQFLREYDENNFLNTLKSKFKSIQFFTCSALGHVENGKNFAPVGVEEPALWLIDKASAHINLKNKWGKTI